MKITRLLLLRMVPWLLLWLYPSPTAGGVDRPNLVFIITDDQGYGDLGSTGNPVIKTPNLDQLASESCSFTDYHVAPTCSPTRAALLTGHWTNRTGVWHTIAGRSLLRANEVTLGRMLADHGYETGMFGKWHLGDNYPYRAEDRGFSEVYRHGGGGVGQTPDVWDNAYFDGAYYHNGEIEPATGFCTDVFFAQANRFIERCAREKKPFFAYLATNAPHGPLHAPREYLDMYADQPPSIATFYGMITNIDENVGRTRRLLRELGIAENTIFIFTTDNGTASGEKIFNAGMRGMKGSPYDGGHRVPFFLHWPEGKMNRLVAIDELAHAVDVVPTLLDLMGVEPPDGLRFDGVSLKPLLDPTTDVQWADRFLITDSQRVEDPVKWRQSAVMSEHWRLVNGKELYQIDEDPGQKRDVAGDHPGQVATMRDFYEAWWAELEPTFAETTEIFLGHPDHPMVTLTAHDWLGGPAAWNQRQIRVGFLRPDARESQGAAKHEGYWAVNVLASGRYEITLRRWPAEADRAITAPLPPGPEVPGASRALRTAEGEALPIVRATLRLDAQDIESKPVGAADKEITFVTELAEGSHRLAPVFHMEGGELGAYYVTVTRTAPESPE